MESPQSPHSSSLWVFALSAIESYRPLHPVPISHLGTKLYSTVLLLFGLRVISWSQKPDLILLEGSQDGDPITWKTPRTISEFTHSRLAVNTTLLKTLHMKAYLLLSSQPWHC